ncbi:helix-turn-helix domain-containing protein [Deinococcus saxicola]|uniref:MarR family winged helix-turn-helix transcriptional regulator n=1 Tax=Deinococcus saxicola TaxID=249406 RepID=UPI0039EF4854
MNSARLHRLARHLRELAVQTTAAHDETLPSLSVLNIVEDVAHHPETPIGEIARRVGLAQSLVSKTVAELREAAVLSTRPDPADGRRVLVSVKPDTLEGVLRQRGKLPIGDTLAQIHPYLSAAQLRRTQELLDELAELLLERPEASRP